MKELPIGRQVFPEFIEQDLLYVDKTRFVWELVRQGKYYFLSRPRRFGKTLLLSTLKAFFEGREDLFRGLYLHNKVKEWKKYPVVRIDYSQVSYKDGKAIFQQSLLNHLNEIASDYGLTLENTILGDAFTELVRTLHGQYGKVVILVDEYDKAMVDTLANEERFEENREVLRGLYSAMKGLDEYLRFVILTGVSRFAKVSVFSGLNNLEDISMDSAFANAVGFTQEELEANFEPYLKQVQAKFGFSWEELLNHYRTQYNGYSWDGESTLYNPFSILKSLKEQDFGNYWFSTGTPTFLTEIVKKQQFPPEILEGLKTEDLAGSSLRLINFPLIPLLFQTGYLTIRRIEREGIRQRFILNYPNEEVRHSFLTFLAAAFVEKDEFEIQPEAIELRDALREERTGDFVLRLQSFLADIPSRLHISQEAYYHSLVYMMLRLVGMKPLLEKETNKGRLDAVLELPDKAYILEFKFGSGTRVKNVRTLSRQALAQIEKKQYYQPYLGSSKKIILFGIGFLNKELDGRVRVLQPS